MALSNLYTALKAKRPAMSIELAHAKTAKDVGGIIADSWYGYGLEQEKAQSGDGYKLSVKTKPETFTGAMKYLWFKQKSTEGKTTIYRMSGMPYELAVTVAGEKHAIEVRKITQ